MSIDLSIIIPCYRDEQELAHILPHISALGNDVTLEVIVVDGDGSGHCKDICRRYGAIYIKAIPCRGDQLLNGAKAAQGRLLWFLHADTVISGQHIAEITKATSNGVNAGFFRFSFAGPTNPSRRFLSFWINFRARYGGVPYGDQGLFVLASRYWKLDGHEPMPLFEEVRLVRRLQKYPDFKMLDIPLDVNPRKWEQDGFIRRTLLNRCLAVAYMLGVPARKIANFYQSHPLSRNGGNPSPKGDLNESCRHPL